LSPTNHANPTSSRTNSPNPEFFPTSAARRSRAGYWAAGILALLAGIVGYVIYQQRPTQQRTDLLYHAVRIEPLKLTVVERGQLESAENRDVICRVRAGTKASNLTIKWVIDDGTLVRQGQLLVELDDSALQDQLKTQRIAVDTAQDNMVQSEENYKITVSQCESEMASAKIAVELAEIDLKKYLEGDYLQLKREIEGKIKLAQSDVEQQAERVGYTERMVMMKYLSPAQLQAEQSKYESYKVNLQKANEELRVLDDYTRDREVKDRTNKLDEARRALDRTITQSKAKILQAEMQRKTKRSIYEQEQDKFLDIEEQIANCRMYAPQDGLVVYFIPEERRWSSNEVMIANGATVKEGQKIMRIPDLRRMMVNTRVHEAMVRRIQGDVWRQTGFSDSLRAALLFNPDAITRAVSLYAMPDVKDKFHEFDNQKIQDGQKALIRIDAMPDRILPGHVKSVATVASQQDWMSADVKVYSTYVTIDESVDGLKTGMSAEVTILIDGAEEEVLAIPLQAIVGGTEMGPQRKCYVKTPEGPKERNITVGLSNEKMAEVRSGLQPGEEVVLNPRVLLGEKVKVRQGGDDSDDAGDSKKKRNGKGSTKPGGGKGGPPMSPNGKGNGSAPVASQPQKSQGS
jgi:multidrug efflux pump subunit AcrA (membrane-fusion protein)